MLPWFVLRLLLLLLPRLLFLLRCWCESLPGRYCLRLLLLLCLGMLARWCHSTRPLARRKLLSPWWCQSS